MRKDTFVHLHAHSEHSLFDGMTKVKDLVKRTAQYDVPAVALTDHGVVSGWAELHKYAHPAGILPIFGVEAYVVDDRHERGKQSRRHLILLAVSMNGFHNLVRLITLSAMYFYRKPVLDLDIIAKHSEGLVCLTACLGGFVARPFFAPSVNDGRGDPSGAYQQFHRLRDVFGDRLYLEVQPYAAESQRVFNDWAFALHDAEDVPLCATNDIHYLEEADKEFHPYVVMAGVGAYQRREGDDYKDGVEKYVSKPGGNHYRSRAEMVEAFAALHGPAVLRREALWNAMASPWEVYERAAAVRFDPALKIPKMNVSEIAPVS